MWKDGAIQKIQFSGQSFLQNAAHQRTAVGLQMLIGQMNVSLPAENPKRQSTGGPDDLFRRIGTEIADDFLMGFCLVFFRIAVGITDNFSDFIQIFHYLHSPAYNPAARRRAFSSSSRQLKATFPTSVIGRDFLNSISLGQDHLIRCSRL